MLCSPEITRNPFFLSLGWSDLTFRCKEYFKSWLPGKLASVRGLCIEEQAWSLLRNQRFRLRGCHLFFSQTLPLPLSVSYNLLPSGKGRQTDPLIFLAISVGFSGPWSAAS